MNRLLSFLFLGAASCLSAGAAEPELKIGLVGLDTSHCVKLCETFNDPAAEGHIPGARIVCAFPGGNPEVTQGWSRVKGFTADLRGRFGVAILDSIAEVAARSDAIMILSLDGRQHLAQAREAFTVHKPVFIDKPLAGNLGDALAIARLARDEKIPIFSASNFRFSPAIAKLRKDASPLRGAISYGPSPIEPHVGDLFYYGVHATESLFTVLGSDWVSVTCLHTDDTDVVSGLWQGRTGVVYTLRNGARPYGITAFGTKKVLTETEGNDFPAIVRAQLAFYRTGKSPVAITDTLAIIAFMEAADQSKHRGGAPVALREIYAQYHADPAHPL